MFDPKKIACHFSEQLYAKQVRLVIKTITAAKNIPKFLEDGGVNSLASARKTGICCNSLSLT
jgi:hypothetical protein